MELGFNLSQIVMRVGGMDSYSRDGSGYTEIAFL